jgi:hypothetical protein
MNLGLDYSSGPIAGSAIVSAGYGFAIRYVEAPKYAGRKHITMAEYTDLLDAGVGVFLVFEDVISDAFGGYIAGLAHAQRALAGAAAVGYTGVIFLSVDDHVTPAQMPAVQDYFVGAASVLGWDRLGVYGFSETLAAVQGARAYWLCGHHPLPGSIANIWQRNTGTVHVAGVECDVNELITPVPDPGGLEDHVALISLPATPRPTDTHAGRWQDTDPATWPRNDEEGHSPLVGAGKLHAVTTGWATGLSFSDATAINTTITGQDGPAADGVIKPSGYIDYLRVFYFPDGDTHADWCWTELFTDVALIGNKSLPAVALPAGATFLVASYTAPAGLHLAVTFD